MTRSPDPSAIDALRAALLARAHHEAEVRINQASEAAENMVAKAKTAAEQRLSAARAHGRAEAALAVADDDAKIRQQARKLVLAAQRDVQDELRRRTREAVQQLRQGETYARLELAVEHQAKSHLGPAATTRESDDGGWLIETPGRYIDARLNTLADWAVESTDLAQPS